VPFLYWIVARVRPDRYNILASAVCVAGIGLVSLGGDFTMRMGDALTLLCGVFYAMHIVAVACFSREHDIFLLTLIQFATAALLGLICGAIFEPFPKEVGTGSIWSLVYLCFFATAAALLMQNVGQKYTPPSAAALILSLESVFGALFSVLFYGERLTLKTSSGFVLIFLAVIISESKLTFLKRKTGPGPQPQ
jgi:drug/metabolite transporter (DMT)-like permease